MKAGQSTEAITQNSRLFQWIKSILRDEFDLTVWLKCKQEHYQPNIKQVMIIALKSQLNDHLQQVTVRPLVQEA